MCELYWALQAATYLDDDAIGVRNHAILRQLWHQLQDVPRYEALGAFVRKLLHPNMTARATAQEALADDSFWAID